MKKRGGVFSTATSDLEKRHNTSGLNSSFTAEHLSFSDYVSKTKDMIYQVRASTSKLVQDSEVDGNAPYELYPAGPRVAGKKHAYRRGVLLTHGLTDSPYFMRHMAAFFQAEGFRVMAVLLPGHGTRPGDMLEVTWQAWARAVEYGTNKLADEVDEVYLAGYSAGGALSIRQSLQDTRIRALFLFSPALQIAPMAAYAWTHKLVSWLFPRMKWLSINPDTDIYKYESFAKNTAEQMYALTQDLEAQLHKHKLSIPVFAVASADDKTVIATAIQDFMSGLDNKANRFICYTTNVSTLAHDTSDQPVEFVNSVVPEQKILSSAHTAILLAPDDAHYGYKGKYANCIHYQPDQMDKYLACKQHPLDCWQGEVKENNLEVGLLRRLMYNPNFAALKLSMQKFISRLPGS